MMNAFLLSVVLAALSVAATILASCCDAPPPPTPACPAPQPLNACVSDGDCQDNNPCTRDLCGLDVANVCSNDGFPDGYNGDPRIGEYCDTGELCFSACCSSVSTLAEVE